MIEKHLSERIKFLKFAVLNFNNPSKFSFALNELLIIEGLLKPIKKLFIDPPSGWRYGFPKEISSDIKDVKTWLVENGYPQEEIDSYGDNFYCRYFNYEDDENTNRKTDTLY
jgi:hypothetical protein